MCCGHAFYCLVLLLSDYLMHVLTPEVVLLLSFLDLGEGGAIWHREAKWNI